MAHRSNQGMDRFTYYLNLYEIAKGHQTLWLYRQFTNRRGKLITQYFNPRSWIRRGACGHCFHWFTINVDESPFYPYVFTNPIPKEIVKRKYVGAIREDNYGT